MRSAGCYIYMHRARTRRGRPAAEFQLRWDRLMAVRRRCLPITQGAGIRCNVGNHCCGLVKQPLRPPNVDNASLTLPSGKAVVSKMERSSKPHAARSAIPQFVGLSIALLTFGINEPAREPWRKQVNLIGWDSVRQLGTRYWRTEDATSQWESTGRQRDALCSLLAVQVRVVVSRCAINKSTVCISRSIGAGLRRKAAQQRGSSGGSGIADNMTTGIPARVGWYLRRRHSSAPSISGICQSVITSCGI